MTICHKANILKAASGLLLEVGPEVSDAYRGRIEVNDVIIDAAAATLVLDPSQFDVIVTASMFGDILSDQIAGLVGGLELAPGANIGDRAALGAVLREGQVRTPDLKGRATTVECTDAVLQRIA